MRSLPFLPRHLLSERWPFFLLPFRLRLLLLSHPLSSPSVTLLQFYQAVKDGSSLVITPFSIPSSATCGPDVDLSSEGSEDVLEDPDDELVSKKSISDSNKEENVPPEAKFMGICISPFFFFLLLPSSFLPFLSSSSLHICTCISPFVAISLYLCAYFLAFAKTFEGPGVIVDVDMPLAVSPTTPIAPVSAVPSVPIFATPAVPVSAVPTAPHSHGS